ncbi:hypothetical protein GGQ84_003010 [Desulfitispora alkaliphila]|uniref:hypothetical protein n=1 Tax=Desulfitispora alkaliphila TaxID=622674 RepID=UPI003D248B99
MNIRSLLTTRIIVWFLFFLLFVSAIAISVFYFYQDSVEKKKLSQITVGYPFLENVAVATVTDADWLDKFQHELNKARLSTTTSVPPISYREKSYWLRIKYKSGEEKELFANRDSVIYDPERGWLSNRKLTEYMKILTSRLDQEHYGKPMSWQQVDQLWPRKTTATAIDLETGHTFDILRFGGYYHADVEPLTANDTEMIQHIYEDWSWKRRAVVVTVGDVQLAGSMNAMPHGQGQITDNQFEGHFCIHFAQSKVHKSTRVDPGHQLMIYKASNKLHEKVIEANPVDFVNFFITAVANGDLLSTQLMTQGKVDQHQQLWDRLKEELRFVAIESIEEVPGSKKDETQVQVNLTVTYNHPINETHHYSLLLNLIKLDPKLGWVGSLNDLAQLALTQN